MCGVAVAVIAPRRCRSCCLCATWVWWLRSSRCVMLRLWWLSSSCMVPQLQSSLSCHHWTTKEEVSRKKKKENLLAGRGGACSREGHGDAMRAGARTRRGGGVSASSRSGRPSRERAMRCVFPPQPTTISLNYLVIYFRYFDPYRIYGTRNETMEHDYLTHSLKDRFDD